MLLKLKELIPAKKIRKSIDEDLIKRINILTRILENTKTH